MTKINKKVYNNKTFNLINKYLINYGVIYKQRRLIQLKYKISVIFYIKLLQN